MYLTVSGQDLHSSEFSDLFCFEVIASGRLTVGLGGNQYPGEGPSAEPVGQEPGLSQR